MNARNVPIPSQTAPLAKTRRRAILILAKVHRFAGLAGSLFFAMWFVSGVFMMYVEMPYFRQSAFAYAGDPALQPQAVRLSPGEAVARATPDAPATRIRLAMLLDRPVFRILTSSDEQLVTIYADTGERLQPLSLTRARRVTEDFARRLNAVNAIGTARHAAGSPPPAISAGAIRDASVELIHIDQWTLYRNDFAAQRPFYRFTLPDPAGTTIYVSQRTGKVVQMTVRRDRLLAWAGPVLHWLYFASLRQNASLWATTVLWLSGGGMLVAISGFVLGFVRLRRRGDGALTSPFRAVWYRWHHWLGLVFGFVVCTWIFSGWMSMTPLDWAPGTGADSAGRVALQGGALQPAIFGAPLQKAFAEIADEGSDTVDRKIREIEFVQVAGKAHLRFVRDTSNAPGLVDAALVPALDQSELCLAARNINPGAELAACDTLAGWDAYYYAKPGTRFQAKALPVVRVGFADAARRTYYIDPDAGAIVQRYETRSRINRWLYQGLHSFSLPALYQRRPLWDLVMLFFLAGGLALSLTAIALTLRKIKNRE